MQHLSSSQGVHQLSLVELQRTLDQAALGPLDVYSLLHTVYNLNVNYDATSVKFRNSTGISLQIP